MSIDLSEALGDSPVVVHWFRRDLRLSDHASLAAALRSEGPVLPLFVFDTDILSALESPEDRRVQFIYRTLRGLDEKLRAHQSGFLIEHGSPLEVWRKLITRMNIKAVYWSRDYEPAAIQRDTAVEELLRSNGIEVHSYKDQVIFEPSEVVKDDGLPYTVFTPFSKKWKARLQEKDLETHECDLQNLLKWQAPPFPELSRFGFRCTDVEFPPTVIRRDLLHQYAEQRNFPAVGGTSRLGVHLRFGTVSVRELVRMALDESEAWLNELIWREFFMQILWYFPRVVKNAFRPEYDRIEFRNDPRDFAAWCEGRTGYPIVDAGMRELNTTGFMHNRVRMITASFLVKHLLVDWRWGESYFARHLLDFELASNNGNWQWVAGSGCDAAPYFRVFNPSIQEKKFDSKREYIRQWVPEVDSGDYPEPIIDHVTARTRVLKAYGSALEKKPAQPRSQPRSQPRRNK